MLKEEIESATRPLINRALWGCGRAADMAMFAFGERRMLPNHRGITREVGEYALHVQCVWRITQGDKIVVGSRDLYYPADYHDVHEDIPSEFEWDRDPNRRDKLVSALFKDGTREFIVEKIKVGEAGSLHILLSDSYCLDVFPDVSLEHEHWRLFRLGIDESHFVVIGDHIDS